MVGPTNFNNITNPQIVGRTFGGGKTPFTNPAVPVPISWFRALQNIQFDGVDADGHYPKIVDDFLSDEPNHVKPTLTRIDRELIVTSHVGRYVHINEGRVLAAGLVWEIPDTLLECPNDAVGFIAVTRTGNVIWTSGQTGANLVIAKVTTSSGFIVDIKDLRCRFVMDGFGAGYWYDFFSLIEDFLRGLASGATSGIPYGFLVLDPTGRKLTIADLREYFNFGQGTGGGSGEPGGGGAGGIGGISSEELARLLSRLADLENFENEALVQLAALRLESLKLLLPANKNSLVGISADGTRYVAVPKKSSALSDMPLEGGISNFDTLVRLSDRYVPLPYSQQWNLIELFEGNQTLTPFSRNYIDTNISISKPTRMYLKLPNTAGLLEGCCVTVRGDFSGNKSVVVQGNGLPINGNVDAGGSGRVLFSTANMEVDFILLRGEEGWKTATRPIVFYPQPFEDDTGVILLPMQYQIDTASRFFPLQIFAADPALLDSDNLIAAFVRNQLKLYLIRIAEKDVQEFALPFPPQGAINPQGQPGSIPYATSNYASAIVDIHEHLGGAIVGANTTNAYGNPLNKQCFIHLIKAAQSGVSAATEIYKSELKQPGANYQIPSGVTHVTIADARFRKLVGKCVDVEKGLVLAAVNSYQDTIQVTNGLPSSDPNYRRVFHQSTIERPALMILEATESVISAITQVEIPDSSAGEAIGKPDIDPIKSLIYIPSERRNLTYQIRYEVGDINSLNPARLTVERYITGSTGPLACYWNPRGYLAVLCKNNTVDFYAMTTSLPPRRSTTFPNGVKAIAYYNEEWCVLSDKAVIFFELDGTPKNISVQLTGIGESLTSILGKGIVVSSANPSTGGVVETVI
jgi:hypothetical protein